MFNPVSTYRIQFHKDFTFSHLEQIIPYLQKLGISTIYASPIFEAVPGSTHGYDGLHPHYINPEIGTEQQLRNIKAKLQKAGIGWIQDIVPNHMAFDSRNNLLADVLEKGPQSVYADFFDVTWNSPLYEGRIMVPFLGGTLEEVIEKGALQVAYSNGRFVFQYYDNVFPLQPLSYETILLNEDGKTPVPVQQLIAQIPKDEKRRAYSEKWNELLLQLKALYKNDAVRNYITARLGRINGKPENIDKISKQQSYRLCHWQETDEKINFRRFFTINGLICLNIHRQEVFDFYHSKIKQLVDDKIFDGLRIDHIDGLYDPAAYLERLRNLVGEDTYIIVEKILERKESLPSTWRVQGNTGYDFLAIANNLFTDKTSEEKFTEFYQKLIKDNSSVHQQLRDKKAYILYHYMAGELENLYKLFIASSFVPEKDLSKVNSEDLKNAIGEFLIQCPVYRYYGNEMPLKKAEVHALKDIFKRVKDSHPGLSDGIDLLERALLKNVKKGADEYNNKVLHFYQRCMQFTGPLMAKGFEDTLMYTYNRFIGHNDVGDSPESFGISIEEFHESMKARQEKWPLSLNATSTHDTKRGEDVRARLNVLTDLPDEWLGKVEEWHGLNKNLKIDKVPGSNDEYFIYQSLAGAYPLSGQPGDTESRLQQYLQKALREGKQNSDWAHPNQEYEAAVNKFISGLFNTDHNFLHNFSDFVTKVADYGIINSFAQVILKFTCPGVPDTYQGTELWDLSFVDPDNRRAVDYKKRAEKLDSINAGKESLQQLWNQRNSGTLKLWLIHTLMTLRKLEKDLFAYGDYIPLQVKGACKDNIIAFARQRHNKWIIVALPLHIARLSMQQQQPVTDIDWEETKIVLPEDAPSAWEHVVLKTKGKANKEIAVKDIFHEFPLAILKMEAPENKRGAGILLHISSLPSPFGIGDFGTGAKDFVDFLKRSRQKYWQILPLNPTSPDNSSSPYSSISSMAGNTMLLSPELMADEGLLNKKSFEEYYQPAEDKVNYVKVEMIKQELWDKAYQNFKQNNASGQPAFQSFCGREAYWLDDYATFVAIKNEYDGRPWFEWPDEYKLRDRNALNTFTKAHREAIDKIKWLQFMFTKQWAGVKAYSNENGIRILGDLPFYVSYDSVDVWANREIFCLDKDGNMSGIAGVPPDYFSKDGQLWGMPTFNWNELKKQHYKWWIGRLKKNLELFDLLRLDHFRALAAYWQVPAGEETAINGQWLKGPGTDFFTAVKKELGKLPFVAEDLGDNMDDVYKLRDEVGLPGMKVLQFAFGDNMATSVDIPHGYTRNCVVYTGTHDNNTTTGWYIQETEKDDRKRIEQYTGVKVNEKNIAATLSKLAYASVANTVILPLQDVLQLDETARMNTPGSAENNWLWRLMPKRLNKQVEEQLSNWVRIYNRR